MKITLSIPFSLIHVYRTLRGTLCLLLERRITLIVPDDEGNLSLKCRRTSIKMQGVIAHKTVMFKTVQINSHVASVISTDPGFCKHKRDS